MIKNITGKGGSKTKPAGNPELFVSQRGPTGLKRTPPSLLAAVLAVKPANMQEYKKSHL
jgi:hypothetical protein